MAKKYGNIVFGRNVRMYRIAAHMTQKDLQDALGYKNKASIGKIENGDSDCPSAMVQKIAVALGVSAVDLLKGSEELANNSSKAKYQEFYEYLPFLAEADEVTLKNIRLILGMRALVEKKDSVSTEQVG